MTKGSTHQEDTAILSVYASNVRASKYVSETNITERRNKPTIILGNFNIYFSANLRTTRQKIQKRYRRTEQYH